MKQLAPILACLALSAPQWTHAADVQTDTLPDPSQGAALEKNGFKPLFNGTDLTGWKKVGGTAEYEVKDGAVRGFGKNVKGNTFLRTEKEYGDFVLTFQMKMVEQHGNSGCQFRSNQRDGDGRVNGYQCEHDDNKGGKRAWTAGVYDEARRGWLYPGKFGAGDGDAGKAFTEQGIKLFKWDDWNTIVIRCQGRHIQTWLNGEKRADFVDTDEKEKDGKPIASSGFIALQVHAGGAGDILWKNLYLKEL